MVVPAPSAVLELLKPITWFPPMWAFACGVISVNASVQINAGLIAIGVLLCGPMVCGASQAVNDWFDREVDSINEPHRPIPSGRVPGSWGLYIAIGWTLLSVLVAALLGPIGLAAGMVGLVLAWAYSAPPFRLKLNGWWGNTAVAACYEGLPWFTGAAIMAAAIPHTHILIVAALYSFGAHGIMTLNDFKSVEGDIQVGIRSLPVQHGVHRAARLACLKMLIPQLIVAGLLVFWDQLLFGVVIGLIAVAQAVLMPRLLADPKAMAPWYNATGVSLYVSGMMITAFALRVLYSGG